MLRAALLALAPLVLGSAPLAAHPHIFIDSGLDFHFDDKGMLSGVGVTWVYDELYTLLLIEDQDLDPDGDGELTDEEIAKLAKQDRNWDPKYEGDIYGTADGKKIALAPPEDFGLTYADGQITSTHYRPLATPVDPRQHKVMFKNYDPWFYAAFDLTLPVTATGADCTADVLPVDLDAAQKEVQRQLAAIPADTIETQFPMVGEQFAAPVAITCAGH
jgi:ABC-type uncharacterized transport system substrate-binding protein